MTAFEGVATAPVGLDKSPGPFKYLGGRLFNWLHGPEFRPLDEDQRTLPSSILFALAERGADLVADDVLTLQRNGLARPALYLSLKAAEDHDEAQRDLLQRTAELGFDYSALTGNDYHAALSFIRDRYNSSGPMVGGEKLGQFSRHGFGRSVNEFDSALRAANDTEPFTSVYMVANYPFIALDVLAKHSIDKGGQLSVIKPERLGQTTLSVGFDIKLSEDGGIIVDYLEHDFDRPSDGIIFDDVLNTGKVKNRVVDFWKDGEQNEPRFVAAVTMPNSVF
jgi:hypothetical protein